MLILPGLPWLDVESKNKLESWIAVPPNQRRVWGVLQHDVVPACLDPKLVDFGHDVRMTAMPSYLEPSGNAKIP